MKNLPVLMKFATQKHILKLYDNHVTKYEFFKRFVNGRKAYIENRFLP